MLKLVLPMLLHVDFCLPLVVFIFASLTILVPAIYDITIRCPDVAEQPTLMDVINAKPCRADVHFR